MIDSMWQKVNGSGEAAIGGGILSEILRLSDSSFVKDIMCDPDQTGDEVKFIAHMRGKPKDVYLLCVVTEIELIHPVLEKP